MKQQQLTITKNIIHFEVPDRACGNASKVVNVLVETGSQQ